MMRLEMPMLGLMLLTLLVWLNMYRLRVGYMIAHRIPAQKASTPEKGAALLPESVNNSANNLKNLFELPVIFYALCIYLIATGQVANADVWLGYAYLLLRVAHSLVHCTSNIVMLRFQIYVASSLVLWASLLRTVWRLVA